MKYRYHKMYLLTGEIFEDEVECISEYTFYKMMDDWNRQGTKFWKYWR